MSTEYTKQFIKWLDVGNIELSSLQELSIGWVLMLVSSEVMERGIAPDTLFWTDDDMRTCEWKVLSMAYFSADELDDVVRETLNDSGITGKCAESSISELALEFIQEHPLPGMSFYRLNLLRAKV